MCRRISTNMLSHTLKKLNVPPKAIDVFNELVANGNTSASILAARLDTPRPSIYDNLKILIDLGLVHKRQEGQKTVFGTEDLSIITDILQGQIESLQAEKKSFEKLLPSLKGHVDSSEPKVKYYMGHDGVKQVLNQVLLHRNSETFLMWPMTEVIRLFGEEYLEDINRKRIRRNISIKVIYPSNAKPDLKKYPFLGIGEGHLREARLAPKKMSWNMGYWMYDDTIAFLSSRKEVFGFVVHSKDLAGLLKTQFDMIWDMSQKIEAEPRYTDEFLKTI